MHGPAGTAGRLSLRPPQRARNPFVKVDSEPLTREDRLNQILDLISARGYDSLNDEDRRFLEEYSRGMGGDEPDTR